MSIEELLIEKGVILDDEEIPHSELSTLVMYFSKKEHYKGFLDRLNKFLKKYSEGKKINIGNSIMKIEYFCPECDGTNVLTQNFTEWDKEKQEWKVADDLPDIDGYSHPIIRWIEWCMDCEEIREMGKREIK